MKNSSFVFGWGNTVDGEHVKEDFDLIRSATKS